MTGPVEAFLNAPRTAELWAACKREIAARASPASDDEVAEMLDEVFGPRSGGWEPGTEDIATDAEVTEMLNEVFAAS